MSMFDSEVYNRDRKLPNGWRWVKLGDVCEFLDSRRIPINDTERQKRISGKSQSNLFPYYGANGQVGWIDDYIFDEPTILLAEDGGNFGSKEKPIAYIVRGRYWVNNHAHVLKPIDKIIDFDYCLHALRIRPDVGDLVSGSTRAKLNQKVAQRIPLPLPPLPEQRRIAAILNHQLAQVDHATAAAEAQLEAATVLPGAYLSRVFPKPGEPLTKGWRWVRLGDVSQKPQYGYTESAVIEGVGPKFLRITDIQNGSVDWDNVPYCRCDKDDYPKFQLEIGDILFARSGATTGKSYLVRELPFNAVFASYLLRIKVKQPVLSPKYAIQFFQSPSYWSQISLRGAAQPNMNAPTLEQITLPIPSISEQNYISASIEEQMDKVNQLKRVLENQLDIINKVSSAILVEALNGGL